MLKDLKDSLKELWKKLWSRFVTWLFLGPATAAILMYANTLMISREPVDGVVWNFGLVASLIAFCFGFMLVSEPRTPEALWVFLFRKAFMMIVAMSGAHLWAAGEAELHPLDEQMVSTISSLAGIAIGLGIAAIGLVTILASSPRRRNNTGDQ